MPYLEATIPLRGWVTDCPFSRVPEGYTVDLLNMLPSDSFRRRVRLGTRPATNRVYEFASDTIQGMIRVISYNQKTSATDVPTRRDRVIIVAGGKLWSMDPDSVTATQIVGPASVTTACLVTSGNVQAVQLGQYAYFVDGTNYIKVDLLSFPTAWSLWNNTATGPSALVTNTVNSIEYKATLIAKYGARIVLSGVKGKENLWWMSEVLNPDLWNATTTLSSGGPIAASVAQLIGPAGDEVVSIFPIGSDGFVFAGKRSLSYLTADPAIDPTGARLATLSQVVGIVGPRAYCEGPEKSVYILAQDGMYRIRPNDFNIDRGELISLNKLDSFFNNVRWELITPVMHYDVERRGVWIFMTRTDGPSQSTHLFYSDQTDGFFPVRFYDPKLYGSTCCSQSGTSDGRNQIMWMSYGKMIGFMDQRLTAGVDGFAASGYSTSLSPTTYATASSQFIYSKVSLGPLIAKQPARLLFKEVMIETGVDDYLPNTLVNNAPDKAARPVAQFYSAETSAEAIAENINNVLVEDLASTVYDGEGPSEVQTVFLDGGAYNEVFTTYEDFGYAVAITGVYSSQDTFIVSTSRVYNSTTGIYQMIRIQNPAGLSDGVYRWVIRFATATTVNGGTASQVVIYAQDYAAPATIVSDDLEIGQYEYCPNGVGANRDETDMLKISKSEFTFADVLDLGYLREGLNNRMKMKVRAETGYVRLSSTGYPFALERVAANAEEIGLHRGVIDVSATNVVTR